MQSTGTDEIEATAADQRYHAVIDALWELGPMTIGELAEHLGLGRQIVRWTILKAVEMGHVLEVGQTATGAVRRDLG